jgi:hypothetical protein
MGTEKKGRMGKGKGNGEKGRGVNGERKEGRKIQRKEAERKRRGERRRQLFTDIVSSALTLIRAAGGIYDFQNFEQV